MSFASSVLNKRVAIDPQLSAAQWELYTDMLPLVNSAAAELNNALRDTVNRGASKDEVRQKVWGVMKDWSNFGANDTEPRYILEDLLEEIYKDE